MLGAEVSESVDEFSESVDEYLQTESHYKIVFRGETVELDCTKSCEWHFTRCDSNDSESIDVRSKNSSNAYKIKSKHDGRATFIIDHVLPKHAGKYECLDSDNEYKLSVEVTVVGKDIFSTSLRQLIHCCS